MKEYRFGLVLCIAGVMVSLTQSNPNPASETAAPPDTYGSVTVSRVVKIAPDSAIYCDIDAFPPVLGKNIPVLLEGTEPFTAGTVDKDVISFLEKTLIFKSTDKPPSIILKNIRRGPTFCLVADIEIDGKDLARLLVEQGLARRIIRLETAEDAPPAVHSAAPLQIKLADSAVTFVASRNSKIFHRSTCPHAKRLAPQTTLNFRTRQEAEQNGRRPCKTCNP